MIWSLLNIFKKKNKENQYALFDALIEERNDVVEYFLKYSTEIIQRVETAKCHELYSTKAEDLGLLTPSLIRDKIIGGYHKGRKLKQKPEEKAYIVYEFDEDMKPLRLRKYNEPCSLDVTFYFINYNNVLFAVPCKEGEELFIYPTTTHKMEYKDGKIWKYSSIESFYLQHEVYDYKSDYIECMEYYYVPELVGSDKKYPIGHRRSPVEACLAKIYMQDNKVSKLLYYKITCMMKELIYTYKK